MKDYGNGCILSGKDVDMFVYDWGTLSFLSGPEVTGAERFSFGHVVLTPGKAHDDHTHPGVEEIIYVLSGEGEQMIDHNEPVTVREGDCIFIKPGVPHSTRNIGFEPLRILVVYAPAGVEEGFRQIPGCKVVPAAALPR